MRFSKLSRGFCLFFVNTYSSLFILLVEPEPYLLFCCCFFRFRRFAVSLLLFTLTASQACPFHIRYKWGSQGVPKTVKQPKYFRKVVKPSLNSVKIVTTFCLLFMCHLFYAADNCLLFIFVNQKENASSIVLNPVEKVKSFRISSKSYHVEPNICSFISNSVLI